MARRLRAVASTLALGACLAALAASTPTVTESALCEGSCSEAEGHVSLLQIGKERPAALVGGPSAPERPAAAAASAPAGPAAAAAPPATAASLAEKAVRAEQAALANVSHEAAQRQMATAVREVAPAVASSGAAEAAGSAGGGAAAAARSEAMARAVSKQEAAVIRAHGSVDAISRVFGKKGTCDKLTGGWCFLSNACDSSRAANCDTSSGVCVCPDYMCADGNGACQFSISEVGAAVSSGVENVGQSVSKIANSVPGAASAMSATMGALGMVGGVLQSAGKIVQGVTGTEGECGTYVSTCMFSGCSDDVSMTASCSYGVCSCMDGFCKREFNGRDVCAVDMTKILGALTPTR